MEFRTQFDKRPRYNCEPGSPIKDILAGEYNKQKQLVVVKKGEENLYAYINSFADSVDINVLLARFANGDKEALLQRAGAYIDISSLPTNINDFIELSRNAENVFSTLPVEVKKKFNNNVVEFVSTIGDPDWIEKMSTSPAQLDQIIVDKARDQKAANKAAAAPKYKNTVYGEVDSSDPVVDEPKINPITGNEVQ